MVISHIFSRIRMPRNLRVRGNSGGSMGVWDVPATSWPGEHWAALRNAEHGHLPCAYSALKRHMGSDFVDSETLLFNALL